MTAVAVLASIAVGVAAQDGVGIDSRILSADTDRPRASLSYRDGLRGTLGLALPLWTSDGTFAREGLTADLAPMVELHEPSGSDQRLPSQFWRGLLSVGATYGLAVGQTQLGLGLRLGHESDHQTAHEFSAPGFLALNYVELPAWLTLGLGGAQLELGGHGRLYVASCTERLAPCRDLEGSTTPGGYIGSALHSRRPLMWQLHPFASVGASGIAGRGLVRAEERINLRVGVYRRVPAGVLELHLLGIFGHDVGLTRANHVSLLGAGVAWTLDLTST